MSKESRKTYTTRIKPSLLKALAHRAVDENRNPCELLEDALKLYFDSLEQQAS